MTQVLITFAEGGSDGKVMAEEFVRDALETHSFCYVTAGGDEQEIGITDIKVVEEA
jgi:hypothetical protein